MDRKDKLALYASDTPLLMFEFCIDLGKRTMAILISAMVVNLRIANRPLAGWLVPWLVTFQMTQNAWKLSHSVKTCGFKT